MPLNRKTFFEGYREVFGHLSEGQVEGLEFLLGKVENDPRWENTQQIAYFLATIQHETASTFQPIKEFRAKKGSEGRAIQDRYWLSGYYGRGYVQITWKKNYEKFGIVDEPDKALEPETAYEIASEGMLKGLFTGKRLSDFIHGDETDYVNARKVVNGLYKANQIAKNAGNFEAILTTAQEADKPASVETVSVPSVEQNKEPQVQTVNTSPPVVEVKPTGVSLTTKITSAIAPIGTFFTAVGLKIGGVQITNGVIITFLITFAVSFGIGAWIYNEGKKREQEKLKWSMDNLANNEKGNVIAKGSA